MEGVGGREAPISHTFVRFRICVSHGFAQERHMCLDDGEVVFLVGSPGRACSVRLLRFGCDVVVWEWVVGWKNGGWNLEYLKAGWVVSAKPGGVGFVEFGGWLGIC